MKNDFNIPPDSEILTWPTPDRGSVPKDYQTDFDQRVLALKAVIKGASVLAAAKLYGVDRSTLTDMAIAAPELADDGKPFGFRVCVPWFRRAAPQPQSTEIPLASGPHAFAQLVLAVPAVRELLTAYKGGLPAHNQRCSEFETLFRRFKKVLKDAALDHAYPLNSSDKGRRALQNWFKRLRKQLLDLGMDGPEDDASMTRLEHLFPLKPMDRVEFDGHQTDVEWRALVPTREGQWAIALISCVWLLVIIDAVSLVVLAWTLVVGKNYNRFDVLRTFAKAITPWVPRQLIVPGLHYVPGAWMPSMVTEIEDLMRAASVAMDNHMAHLAKLTTENLGDHQLGIVNLGYSGVPQGRPNVEGFFKRIEDCILRFIAGGFRPPRELGEGKRKVSRLSPSDHPVDLEALEDLLDVVISAYNITEHGGLQGRSPKEVFDAHVTNGGWTTRSTLTSGDAVDLITIRVEVTIRGSKKEGVLPVVNYEGARYRAVKMNTRWDLIGNTFKATLPFNDIRTMSLWDENGDLFVVLQALPPYSGTAHSLDQRKKSIHWRNRGLYEIPVGGDAIIAYLACVRDKASQLQWATDEFVRINAADPNAFATPRPHASTYQVTDTLAGLAPRGGHVGLTSRRKSP